MVYDNVVQYCKENKLSISGFEKLCGLANGTVRLWKNGFPPGGRYPSTITTRSPTFTAPPREAAF